MESRWVIPRFTSWLLSQHQRQDVIGKIGLWLALNKKFPSCSMLEKFLDALDDFKYAPNYCFEFAPSAYEEYLAFVKKLKDSPVPVRKPHYAPPPAGTSPPFMLDPVKKQYISVSDFMKDEKALAEYEKYMEKKLKRAEYRQRHAKRKKGRF